MHSLLERLKDLPLPKANAELKFVVEYIRRSLFYTVASIVAALILLKSVGA